MNNGIKLKDFKYLDHLERCRETPKAKRELLGAILIGFGAVFAPIVGIILILTVAEKIDSAQRTEVATVILSLLATYLGWKTINRMSK